MIKTFRCQDTAALFAGSGVARWANLRDVAERKLQMLNRAARLDDLRVQPNNRLELLKGDRAGLHSIRLNDQWRLRFELDGASAYDVEIVVDH